MGILGTEGFDYYNGGTDSSKGAQSRWVKGFLDQTLVTGRFGGKAFSSVRNGGTENVFRVFDTPSTSGSCCIGLAVKLTNLGTQLLLITNAASATQWMIFSESDGRVSIANSGGGVIAQSSAGAITTGVWYYIEVACQIADSATWQVWVDGVSKGSGSGIDTKGQSTNEFGGLALVEPGTGTCLYDDMYWKDDATPLGPQLIEYLPPTSDVSGGVWSASTGSSKFALVDELAADPTDYVYSATIGDEQRFRLGLLSSVPSSIACVNLVLFTGASDGLGTDPQVTPTIKSGSSQTDGSAISLVSAAKFKNALFPVDPATSAAWTYAAVSALEAGFKVAA